MTSRKFLKKNELILQIIYKYLKIKLLKINFFLKNVLVSIEMY